jgi:mannose-1-phosphate guanylyltransferase
MQRCRARPASRLVYLLGAVPEGPHDQLGYIVPWHDAIHMPTSVYEFVERPDVREARRLISVGGLWNTFMFGGTLSSLVNLFHPEFATIITELRAALRAQSQNVGPVARTYDVLPPVDFSQNVLAKRIDQLHVLRLPRRGWWPIAEPAGCLQLADGSETPRSAIQHPRSSPTIESSESF